MTSSILEVERGAQGENYLTSPLGAFRSVPFSIGGGTVERRRVMARPVETLDDEIEAAVPAKATLKIECVQGEC
jgi:hypothetical protein